MKNIPEDNLLDLFIGTLKENIQHEVHLWESKSLENAFIVARKVEIKNMVARRITTNTYIKHNVPSANPTQLTRLAPQQLDERREKRLCFNCDNRYSKGHKFV